MHTWGDEGVDWEGISEAARYIGENLRKWGRVCVSQYKEKFGEVRVYCSFGWYDLHSITHPGHAYIRYRKNGILWHLNYISGHGWFFRFLNRFAIPYQKFLYTYFYGRALRKWPHLRLEILSGADWSELLAKYGVHKIRTGETSCVIRYDWHPDNWKEPKE